VDNIRRVVLFLNLLTGNYSKAAYFRQMKNLQEFHIKSRTTELIMLLKMKREVFLDQQKLRGWEQDTYPTKICYNQQQQQLSLLSQASWGRLEMKPTRNKGRRSTKHKNTKAQKKKKRSCFRHIGLQVSKHFYP
jgi:hypothetical protein